MAKKKELFSEATKRAVRRGVKVLIYTFLSDAVLVALAAILELHIDPLYANFINVFLATMAVYVMDKQPKLEGRL